MAKTLKTILSLDGKPFADGVKKASRGMKTMQRNMKNFNRQIGAPLKAGIGRLVKFAAAAVAAGAALAGVVINKVANLGDALSKMSDRTGISIEQLSKLQHAANLSDSDLTSLGKGMKGMALLMYEAGRGTKTYTDVLDDLGIKYDDIKNQNPEKQLSTFMNAIANIQDPTRKAALAVKVFGRAGTQMLPMLKDGATGLAKMFEEAERLGVVFTKEQTDGAVQFNDQITRLKASFLGLLLSVVSFDEINIAIGKLINKAVELRKSKGFTDFVDKAKEMAFKVINKIATIGIAIKDFVNKNKAMFQKFGPIFAGVAVAFASGLATPLILLAGTMVSTLATTLISPIGAIMLALVASFKIGDAIQQSMGLEDVFAKALIKASGFGKKIAVELFRALHPDKMSDEQRKTQLAKIKKSADFQIGLIEKGEKETRNPADILIDDMVDSFKKGKNSLASAFKDLMPETSFDFEEKLRLMSQNSAIKKGMESTKIMDFGKLNPFASTDYDKNDSSKDTSKVAEKQLKAQNKTNTILERAVNTEGMTFA